MNAMDKAKSSMVLYHPFFATLILLTPLIEDRSMPTAGTDMVRIYYNPEWINSLSPQGVLFIFAHEALHIILKHGLRKGVRDHKRWNIACDHVINLELKACGFVMPTGKNEGHCNPKYVGWSAEKVYDDEECENGGGGSGAGPYGLGEDLMSPGDMTESEKQQAEREIDALVAKAALNARMQGRGSLPANLELLIDSILNPPLPWFDLLREYMVQTCRDGENWGRRDRRNHNFYLPDKRTERMGELIVIGDSSGSMYSRPEVFSQLGNELAAMMDTLMPERIRVIWADDTECGKQEIFEPGDPIDIHPMGGGGTDMRKPLQYVEQFDPLVVILMTDTETPWPKSVPYPFICLSTTKGVAPFGQTIHLP